MEASVSLALAKVDTLGTDISEEAGTADMITFTNSPEEALKDADIVVTDTWCVYLTIR